MEKESIKLVDFLNDVNKSLKIKGFNKIMKPNIVARYVCSKCGKGYSEEDKFCSKDGEKIIKETYEVRSDEYEDFVRDIFWNLSEGGGTPEDFPYAYVDSVEKRGDGDGYYMNYIFRRKSDGKFFYYTSYDGRIEENELDETTQKVTVKWDFEKHFS